MEFFIFHWMLQQIVRQRKGLSCRPSYHDEQLSWDAEKESDKPTPINMKTKQTLQRTDKHH
jgi:hypothetical protein